MIKSINLKVEEELLNQVKEIGKVYHKNMSESIREALNMWVKDKKNDFFYRMSQLPECSKEETDEIMMELNSMTAEDMEVVREEEVEYE